VGTSFNNLVALYQGQCEYQEEEPSFLQQLENEERTYGPDPSGRSLAAQQYARFVPWQGAEGQISMTAIDKSALVADALGTVSLARDLHRYGRDKAADALFQQAAARVERILGPDDLMLAKVLEAYSEFLVSVRREAEASPIRERSNRIRGRTRPASGVTVWPDQIPPNND
jgi:hypothetical protein